MLKIFLSNVKKTILPDYLGVSFVYDKTIEKENLNEFLNNQTEKDIVIIHSNCYILDYAEIAKMFENSSSFSYKTNFGYILKNSIVIEEEKTCILSGIYDLSSIEDMDDLMKKIRLKIIDSHIKKGVIFKGLENIYIDKNVVIEKGTIIHNNNTLVGNTFIGKECLLNSGNIIHNSTIGNQVKLNISILRDCTIGSKTTVGPFAHIHTNSKIDRMCRVGNYVEIKNSTLGINTKAAHLAYVGDADIGNQCNIGCGTIFVNYDGMNKHRSTVGDSVFIGSNSNIIAPVRLEDNSYIAAGTTVTVDLPKNCMCIGRNRETIKENRSRYRKTEVEKKYFGTDGIRGIYGEFLTEEIAYMCGNYLGYSACSEQIVVGRDNRVSGESLSQSLIKGIIDAGAKVIDLGIVSTPIVAHITNLTNSNYGVMLSASHNPYNYNGIKIFNFDGRKLTAIEEIEIEKHIDKMSAYIGEAKGIVESGLKYIDEYFDNIAERMCGLEGLKIVLDSSNGALSAFAEKFFKRLGCEVFGYFDNTDGRFINDNCGAVHPNKCKELVIKHNADIGLCFDGDADRLIAIDNKGNIVDGDSIIYIIGKYLKDRKRLINDKIVGTFHTNLAVEHSLKEVGIILERTDIGDHFVMEKMIKDNLVVGGEQSGHIILREFSNTGDGLLAGVFLCKIIIDEKKTLAELNNCKKYPQVNLNIITEQKKIIMNDTNFQNYIEGQEKLMEGKGRLLVRASGTEPKLRIMAEGEDSFLLEKISKDIQNYIYDNYNSILKN